MQHLFDFIKQEWNDLIHINKSNRTLGLPIFAALASGLPLLIGTYFKHIEYGLISSLGGMIFLYLQNTHITHRLPLLLALSTLMSGSFLFGLMVQHIPVLIVPTVFVLTWITLMMMRFFQIAGPGAVFIMMAAMIGIYMPVQITQIPYYVGLNFMGALLACCLAFIYSTWHWFKKTSISPTPRFQKDFDIVVINPLLIAITTAFSLLCAQLLEMPRPYWVPVSTLVVIQAVNLKAVWQKQMHRLIGTALGMILAFFLLSLNLTIWQTCLLMMGLTILIEFLVVRHYASAAIFITPLTIFLAELATGSTEHASLVIKARALDTLLGCIVGFLGALVIYRTQLRQYIKRLFPSFKR